MGIWNQDMAAATRFGLGVLILLIGPVNAFASTPLAITLHVELKENPQPGDLLQVREGSYPPEAQGGWFAIRSGNDAGVFEIDERTGSITIAHPERWENPRAPIELVIEQGNPSEAQRPKYADKRQFLLGAGLSEREICRELGLVTSYEIQVRIDARNASPPKKNTAAGSPDPSNLASALKLLPSRRDVKRFSQGSIDRLKTLWGTGGSSETDPVPRTLPPPKPRSDSQTSTSAGEQPAVAERSASVPETEANSAKAEPIQNRNDQETANRAKSVGLLIQDDWLFFARLTVSLLVVYLLYRNDKTRRTLMQAAETYRRENQALKAELQQLVQQVQRWDQKPQAEITQEIESAEHRTNTSDWAAEPAEPSPSANLRENGAPSRRDNRQVRQESHSNFPSAPLSRGEHLKNEGELRPASPSSDTPEKVNELLEDFSETFGIESPSSDAEPSSWDASENRVEESSKTAFPLEPEEETSISDYMDYLLASYSGKAGPEAAPNTRENPASAPAEDLHLPEPAADRQAATARNLKEVPQPVATYDVEGARSQIEALRQTSNLNVASALRKASSRRRRKRVALWMKFSVLLAVVYVALILLLG